MYYLTPDETRELITIANRFTDYLIDEMQGLMSFYDFDLRQGDINTETSKENLLAMLFERVKTNLAELDDSHYLANRFKRLRQKEVIAYRLDNVPNFKDRQKISEEMQDIYDEFTFEQYRDLKTFIETKQCYYITTKRDVNQYLNEKINGAHGFDVDTLLLTLSKNKEKYLSKHVFNTKNIGKSEQEIINSLFVMKALQQRYNLTFEYMSILLIKTDLNDRLTTAKTLTNILTSINNE